MHLGRMWNGDEPVRHSTRGVDRCGLQRRRKPGLLFILVEMSSL